MRNTIRSIHKLFLQCPPEILDLFTVISKSKQKLPFMHKPHNPHPLHRKSSTAPTTKTRTREQISFWELVDLIPALLSIVYVGVCALVTGFFLGQSENGAKSLHLHVGYAVIRRAVNRLSILQLQFISPSTDTMYEIFNLLTGGVPESVDLGHGAKGHWLGNSNAKNVLVWYHGGGFALPANHGYFYFFSNILSNINSEPKTTPDHDLAIFVLSYTLTPHAQYPTQLIQAVACLEYVLSTHSPKNIYIGGDSAGGNLTMGVLSHLSHPHPAIKTLALPNREPLAGCILISPWMLLDTEFPDHEIDSRGDLITEDVALPWSTAYLGTATRDNYTDIAYAGIGWYREVAKMVEEILVMGGGNEILLPVVQQFAGRLMSVHHRVELFIGNRECHVAPVYNRYIFDSSPEPTEQEEKLISWLDEAIDENTEKDIPKSGPGVRHVHHRHHKPFDQHWSVDELVHSVELEVKED